MFKFDKHLFLKNIIEDVNILIFLRLTTGLFLVRPSSMGGTVAIGRLKTCRKPVREASLVGTGPSSTLAQVELHTSTHPSFLAPSDLEVTLEKQLEFGAEENIHTLSG